MQPTEIAARSFQCCQQANCLQQNRPKRAAWPADVLHSNLLPTCRRGCSIFKLVRVRAMIPCAGVYARSWQPGELNDDKCAIIIASFPGVRAQREISYHAWKVRACPHDRLEATARPRDPHTRPVPAGRPEPNLEQ